MFFALFNKLTGQKTEPSLSVHYYNRICQQSRKQHLYNRFQIPDSPQGRLEMLIIHLFMVLYVLKGHHKAEASAISQELVNLFVVDIDQSLREMYISDKKMQKSFKYALEGFYGRLYSYDAAVRRSREVLQEKLFNNVYQNLVKDPSEVLYLLSDYIYDQIEHLRQNPIEIMDFVEVEGPFYGTTICSRV
jgi:cytochrome b pre-mRNA-processing protein 3